MKQHKWIRVGIRDEAVVDRCRDCPAIREMRKGFSTYLYRRAWLEPLIKTPPKCYKAGEAQKEYTEADLE